MQVVDGVRVLLAEDGHEHIGTVDFALLVAARGLHVHDGALDNALKALRGLRVHFLRAGHARRVLAHKGAEAGAQRLNVCGAGAQHLGGAGVVQQRQQQVLHGDEFLPLLARLHKCHVEADLEFLRNHAHVRP